jgi:N-acetylglutamate synthase-like GNAT family acetyltransferase
MTIRPAQSDDIPSIVDLLKKSLGESLLPKSEAYWRWKHVDNPFGASPVLLAEENGVLIGVRAFMRWSWSDGVNTFRAIRAVDTATHPDHQGKGIFKKLTLQLVDESKSDGIHFVFNTPNGQSRPGYLKMGWQDAGRLPVRFLPINPLRRLAAFFGNKADHSATPFNVWMKSERSNLFWSALKSIHGEQLATPVSKEYLTWRYGTVPVVEYYALSHTDGDKHELLIYRFKTGKLGKELRITDYISTGERKISSAILHALNRVASASRTTYITFSGTDNAFSRGVVLKRGPIVTVRSLSLTDLSPLIDFNRWRPSLGDLELF